MHFSFSQSNFIKYNFIKSKKSLLVFRNQRSYFYETDLRLTRATEPIKTTLKNLVNLIGLPSLSVSINCIEHFLDHGFQLGVYKEPSGNRKAHLDSSIPGKNSLYTNANQYE